MKFFFLYLFSIFTYSLKKHFRKSNNLDKFIINNPLSEQSLVGTYKIDGACDPNTCWEARPFNGYNKDEFICPDKKNFAVIEYDKKG